MYKKDFISFLFILSFPVYGFGSFVSASTPSIGFMISVSVHLVIILFYCIDILYKNEVSMRVNWLYGLTVLFLLSSVASLFIAFYNGLPETTLRLVITKSILILTPLHSFIIVSFYSKDGLTRLLLIGLSVLLAINMVGYFGIGLANETHSIEGRVNFPFLDSFYSGAGLVAIINLILIYYLRNGWSNAIRFSLLAAYFVVNSALLYYINSRLAILSFMIVILMAVFGVVRARGVFLVSMFLIPILLSSGVLIYQVLQQTGLENILQRMSAEDVHTFNGRAYIWQDALDWLLYDQRGLLFGNGYKGHYFLDMLPDVVKLWDVKEGYYLHLHSTSLEILVSQGVIFYIIYCYVFYRVYIYFKNKHREGTEEGALFPVVVFLLLMMQIDTFLYMDNLGAVLLAMLVAKATLVKKVKSKSAIRVEERPAKIVRYHPLEKTQVYGLCSDSRS